MVLKIENVMVSDVITIEAKATVRQAVDVMNKHEIGCLVIVDEEGKISLTPYSFPTLQAMKIRTIGGRGSSSISPVTRIQTARAYPNHLYIAHTQDYLIKLLDLDTSQIIRTFSRKYAKVKHESQELAEFLMAEYQNDVQKL